MEAGGPPNPPQSPGNPDLPPWGAPGSPGAANEQSASGAPSGLWWAGAVVVAIALGVGGYFLGSNHEADNYKPGAAGYQEIYTAGAQAGAAVGDQAGKKSGARYGKKVGFKQGNAAGIKEGTANGTAAGASAALGGFSWNNGTHYIVSTIDPTLSGVPTAIDTQTAMQPNIDYSLCSGNTSTVCSTAKKK